MICPVTTHVPTSFACQSCLSLTLHNNKLVCWWYQDQIDVAVKQLLALKAEFKKLTGQDYKPGMAPPTPASSAPSPATTTTSSSSPSPSGLYERVAQQGEVVRKLKSEKAPKVFRCNFADSRDVVMTSGCQISLMTHPLLLMQTQPHNKNFEWSGWWLNTRLQINIAKFWLELSHEFTPRY